MQKVQEKSKRTVIEDHIYLIPSGVWQVEKGNSAQLFM